MMVAANDDNHVSGQMKRRTEISEAPQHKGVIGGEEDGKS